MGRRFQPQLQFGWVQHGKPQPMAGTVRLDKVVLAPLILAQAGAGPFH